MAAWKHQPLAGLAALRERLVGPSGAAGKRGARGGRRPEDVKPTVARAAAPSFRELMDPVEPLAEGPEMAPLGPGQSVQPRGSPIERSRLWIEESRGQVQGRAPEVPLRVLLDLMAGKVPPRRQLDLHRMSASQARLELTRALRQAQQDEVPCMLLIVGRGTHSGPGGPVMGDVVVHHLAEVLADAVLAFTTAPRRWGGEGALLVRLRSAVSLDH